MPRRGLGHVKLAQLGQLDDLMASAIIPTIASTRVAGALCRSGKIGGDVFFDEEQVGDDHVGGRRAPALQALLRRRGFLPIRRRMHGLRQR